MWIELEILREKDAPDWAEMGVKKPRNYVPERVVVRRLVWGENILWVEEHGDGSLVQMTEETEPLLIKNDYQELRDRMQSVEPDDLEV